ncbi:hypothetical protein F2P79_025186 [Pimephales promelas]|nr:hypothetical protein F2P79_025186 [Pimephales promelas]
MSAWLSVYRSAAKSPVRQQPFHKLSVRPVTSNQSSGPVIIIGCLFSRDLRLWDPWLTQASECLACFNVACWTQLDFSYLSVLRAASGSSTQAVVGPLMYAVIVCSLVWLNFFEVCVNPARVIGVFPMDAHRWSY